MHKTDITAIANGHKNVSIDRTRSFEDMVVYRHTHTHRQTDTLIAILRFPIGGGITNLNHMG